jgi:hypothetical protein
MGVLIQGVWLSVPVEDVRVMVLLGKIWKEPEAVTAGVVHPPVVVTVYVKVPETVGVPEMVT